VSDPGMRSRFSVEESQKDDNVKGKMQNRTASSGRRATRGRLRCCIIPLGTTQTIPLPIRQSWGRS
jgi:hypothetical protein